MPEPAFLTFEILTYLLFAACLWHTARQGSHVVMELVFALVYGVFLEWMTLRQLEAYEYGQFMVMFDGAPLCIGLGWAVIIYSGMQFVQMLEMPTFGRPFLAGFMALNIDLAMDAIAIRLGFWNWVIPMDSQWFGVPWGNFWAWYIVVTSYSGLLYWLRSAGWASSGHMWRRLAYPLLAFVGSAAILAVANWVFANLFIQTELLSAMSMFLLLLLGAIVVYSARPVFKPSVQIDPVVVAVPLVFHLFCTIMGFAGGFYARLPVLAVVGLVMFAAAIGLHLWPLITKNRVHQANGIDQ